MIRNRKGEEAKRRKGEDSLLASLPISPLDPKITAFLKKHHLLTLATTRDNTPWVAHCFYAFMEKEACLVFTTDDDTRHGMEMSENPKLAAGIAWETKVVGQVRGAQVSGRAVRVEEAKRRKGEQATIDEENTKVETLLASSTLSLFDPKLARSAYLTRFPYAAAMKLNLWVLVIDTIKYTDNRMGFGKKLLWERS